MSAVLLVGHGSRDPRAGRTVRTIGRALAQRTGRRVEVAHVELDPPTTQEALLGLARAGVGHVDVVPLLFAPGHHVVVDVPDAVAAARAAHPGLAVDTAGALLTLPGATGALLDAVEDRLADALGCVGADLHGVDGFVLAASGSSRPEALATLDALASAWGGRRGLPTRAASTSGSGPRVADVVADLIAAGRTRVAVGALFVADGRLPDLARHEATMAGALAVGDVVGDHPRLLDLLAARVAQSRSKGPFDARGPQRPSRGGRGCPLDGD